LTDDSDVVVAVLAAASSEPGVRRGERLYNEIRRRWKIRFSSPL